MTISLGVEQMEKIRRPSLRCSLSFRIQDFCWFFRSLAYFNARFRDAFWVGFSVSLVGFGAFVRLKFSTHASAVGAGAGLGFALRRVYLLQVLQSLLL